MTTFIVNRPLDSNVFFFSSCVVSSLHLICASDDREIMIARREKREKMTST